MFERFTADARTAVVEAQLAAREQGAREIAPRDVFTGLARVDHGEARRLLDQLGVSLEEVLAELERVRRRGGISDAEVEALTEFGIDVEQIVERVERTHGPGALADTGRRGRRGHIPFTGEAKKTLELSLREAVKLGDKHLGQEHMLLALVQQKGAVAELLAARGVDYAALRRAVGQGAAG
ncbi:Clp protease N-terminal domain-containing protein [Amycolatopsis sp. PS_44_ISF1]|uniref:Clp protease N-terminal domain-containing protein n=1 Tax=Amycolatopsis sp. PS_44_ISF1 TaxID=2974917 RepID=UPI0028E00F99|nr:Clp protease N-terminal domain-containing protein [Amycolatopsis sp. PS_44_ISF1]MDT8909965.1 ATPase [Amycolatopsis sp. PS_44_ISF1]